MYPSLKKIVRNIPRAMADPRRAASLAYRRMFPFGIVPKDPEAYRIGAWTYGDAPRAPLSEIFPGVEETDLKVFRSYDRKRDLSLDAQELLAICAIAAHTKPRRLVEIGTSDGNTTLNLVANAADGARIVTVDLPEDWDGVFQIAVPEMMKNVTDRAAVGRQFRAGPYRTQVTQVFGDSASLDYARLDGPFDLAFIDGCHYYDYVMADTRNCLANLRSGGVIIWHDYGMIEDVSRVVDEFAARLDIKVVTGTRLAVAVTS